jgi:methyl-accepting chemotaxis protein
MPAARRPASVQSAPTPGGFGEFFRYHGWMSPGVRLFRSIAFPAKAACVALAFVVPMMMALGFLAQAALDQVDTARAERAGVAYVKPVLELMRTAQSRRLQALGGTGALDDVQAKVQAAFQAVQAKQAEFGKAMNLEPAFADLERAHEALLRAPRGADEDATLAAHVDYLVKMTTLVRAVSDGSQLALDPDLDTYYLMRAAVLGGPRMAENLARLRGLGRTALLTQDSRELSVHRRQLLTRWTAANELLREDVDASVMAVLGATPEVGKLVDLNRASTATDAFIAAVQKQLLGMALTGSAEQFAALGTAAVEAQDEVDRVLLQRLDDRLQARIDRLQRVLALQLAVAGTCMLIAAYLMLAFYRVMMGGLNEVARHLRQITLGNLTTAPAPWGRDEAAQLMTTLGEMQASLRHVVSGVLEGSNQVQNASGEISAASNDLAQRTERSAASLEQTASSMEQIAATVRQTSDTVAGARSIVEANAKAATRGGQVIAQVVDTMSGIRASSGKIGEIIGAIDGIAFQTNILALNAAVEAARAGEQGRGFAVVATEVRALAGRSAAAAKEIKALIGASLAQVEAGNRVAAEAGSTIGEIVGNAERIAGMMNEISTATRQQSVGVGQVGAAVQELDRSTQQNAALVEQTSAAAGALSQQARTLADEVAFFKID